ncbi:hypothetical protein ACFFQF_28805 [Haladaptatus pallidirubidus]|uniref:Uncharacterized protein n=1 Tax=Haladaptatus pallidirubidus TaxID=1008152 RepID=A0AAV3UJN9_9EURY|nr:hypothetical protein [Haladaptatus pallidirubidus]
MSKSNDEIATKISNLISRSTLVIIGLLVLFIPVILLVIMVGFLSLAQGIVLAELSVVEIIELYLLEVLVFASFAYLLYRLLLTAIEKRLPGALNALETSNKTSDIDETHQESNQGSFEGKQD